MQRLRTIERELTNRQLEADFHAFVRAAWPHVDQSEFVDGWHVRALCRHLQAVTDGYIKRLLVNYPPRASKPVSVDAMVLTRDRGLIRLGEIAVGDHVWTHLGRWRPVTAIHEQGMLPVLRLTTRNGRSVEAEAGHPFLTPDGWTAIGQLRNDDIVGLPPCRVPAGSDAISEAEAGLLGYLVGDGCCRGTPNITAEDDGVVEDVQACAAELGFSTVVQSYKMRSASLRRVAIKGSAPGENWRKPGGAGPVRRWLTERELWGQSSYTKFVPRSVMQGSDAIVTRFLAAYWSCDGFVVPRGVKRDGVDRDDVQIGCDSVSKRLLEDIQLLLWRLGVRATLRQKITKIKTKKQGDTYTSYSLSITRQDDCMRFAKLIHMKHRKAERLNPLRQRRFDFDQPIWGESVASVEPAGEKPCRCLTVDEDHSFTANGFAVHNSLVVSVLWPAWTWCRRHRSVMSGPQVDFLMGSYGAELAEDLGKKTRDLVLSDWYQSRWGEYVRVRTDRGGGQSFENDHHGRRQAVSVGGSLIGFGGVINCCDDPSNSIRVESESELDRTWEWFKDFSTTRLNDRVEGAVVVVMQRLNELDVSGRLIQTENFARDWVHFCLPARYDPGRHCETVLRWDGDGNATEVFTDPRRVEGESFDPVRFPIWSLQQDEISLGPYLFSGRFQQSPTPKGGGIILEEWWQLWPPPGYFPDVMPPCDACSGLGRLQTREGAMRCPACGGTGQRLPDYPETGFRVLSIDTAQTAKTENDWWAATVWGVWYDKKGHTRALMMEAWRVRLPINGTKEQPVGFVQKVIESARRRQVDVVLVENKANGFAVVDELRRLMRSNEFRVEFFDPTQYGDKIARTYAVQPFFSAGYVFAPDRQWASDVLAESAAFPKGKHDDWHDTVTMALIYLRRMGVLKMDFEQEEEAIREITFVGRADRPGSVQEHYGA